jgi:hypothetical protein
MSHVRRDEGRFRLLQENHQLRHCKRKFIFFSCILFTETNTILQPFEETRFDYGSDIFGNLTRVSLPSVVFQVPGFLAPEEAKKLLEDGLYSTSRLAVVEVNVYVSG